MSRENPGAYYESRNRLQEKEKTTREQREAVEEFFAKKRTLSKIENRFDIFELRRKIETGHSLESLRNEIGQALKEERISQEDFDSLKQSIDTLLYNKEQKEHIPVNTDTIPLSDNAFAQKLESSPLGEDLKRDITGFAYGFFVQWSAILVILLWKIIYDFLMLPRDIIDFVKNNPK